MTARGHKLDNLSPQIHEAAVTIDRKLITPYTKNSEKPSTNPNKNKKSLYFHWQYHPHGISNSVIRYHYDKYLKDHLPIFNKMTLAISRPANLRDKLTKTSLQLPEGDTVSSKLK
jgi:hypothetical protein